MAVFAITGGAGFIGSHLADDLLADRHSVRVLDDLSTGRRGWVDRRASLLVADVANGGALDQLLDGVDAVFHLAAIASIVRSHQDWAETHRVNQGGTVAVLDAARRAGGVPVVYASSAAVYGEQAGPANEAMFPAPRSAYGADKLGSELHASVAFSVHGVPTAGLRFFNVYGPRQDPRSPYSGVISIFFDRVMRHRPLVLHGDGLQERDFVYVGDAVRHLRAAADLLRAAPRATVANVCTGRGTTVRGLADCVSGLLGRPANRQFGPARDGDIRVSLGDPTWARSALGVTAGTTLEEGLATMFARTALERAAA